MKREYVNCKPPRIYIIICNTDGTTKNFKIISRSQGRFGWNIIDAMTTKKMLNNGGYFAEVLETSLIY